MKKNTLMLALLGGILMIACASVQAQSRTMRVSISFDFAAANKTMKAGEYTIHQVSAQTVLLRGTNRKSQAYVVTPQNFSSVKRHPQRLVFRRYGTSYFLSEIWLTESSGIGLPLSKKERAIARSGDRPQKVAIALR
jgi:hypothetical protein